MSLYEARPQDLRAMMLHMQKIIDQHSELLERLTGFLTENRPMLSEVVEAVCEFYEISQPDLIAHSRLMVHSHARLIAYYLGHKLTRLKMPAIARRLHRDPSTVQHGFHEICKRVRRDDILRDDIDVLRSKIAEKVLLRNTGRVPS
jgi:chromosomal replication initiation ATPase DnaA